MDLDKRKTVKYFVSEWKPYTDFAAALFRNLKIVIDRYHFTRQIIWAFETVRKSEQKKYGRKNRLCFKNSKRILTKRAVKSKDYQKNVKMPFCT